MHCPRQVRASRAALRTIRAWWLVAAIAGCTGGVRGFDTLDAATPDALDVAPGADRTATDGDPRGREVCDNGLDDNGNGLIDEGCACNVGQHQSCYTGPLATRGRGACRDGTVACAADASGEIGAWGPCRGDVVPAVETCGGTDLDCDGVDSPPCATDAGPADVPEPDVGSSSCPSGTIACGLACCDATLYVCTGGNTCCIIAAACGGACCLPGTGCAAGSCR